MSDTQRYHTYILSSFTRTLYIGVTRDLLRRVYEHKHKLVEGFTSRYNIDRLVYFEEYGEAKDAILREKQIKGWVRARKVELIETMNPEWRDLSEGWYDEGTPAQEATATATATATASDTDTERQDSSL